MIKGLIAHGSNKDLKMENDRKLSVTDASIDTVSPRKDPFLKYLHMDCSRLFRLSSFKMAESPFQLVLPFPLMSEPEWVLR